MRFAAVTDIGLYRKRNEDQYWIDSERKLFVVCDGMGGHRGGDVASRLAVDTLRQTLSFNGNEQIVTCLRSSVEEANQVVYRQGQADPDLSDMGTTLTAAIIHEGHMTVAHVGDSSLYHFRDGHLSKITRDHTLAGRMLAEGLINPQDLAGNQYNHVLTRAIGVDPQVEIDVIQIEVTPGDWIMLCTDGLTDLVRDAQIAAYLAQAGEPQDKASALVNLALQQGGFDNITVVLISI